MPPPAHDAAIRELRRRLGGRLLTAETDLLPYRSDFGRIVRRAPLAVARPVSAEEVAGVVRVARDAGLKLVVRGQAHGQSGQSASEGGILLDSSLLSRAPEIDRERRVAVCDGGTLWRDVADAALAAGLVPPVTTNNLNVSVGGTLSVAGLGVASFRYGTQADNVLELEAVTGTGEIVRCSERENRRLFDAARCGLGSFGAIVRATLRLVPAKPRVRKHFLLYDDLEAFHADAALLMERDAVHSLEGWCAPALMGLRRAGDGMALGTGMRPFAHWLYPLHATVEFAEGETPRDAEALDGLRPYRTVHAEDMAHGDFLRRLDPVYELWRRSGYWDMAHPWMEAILPWEIAPGFVERVLAEFPPNALGPGGHILLWPCRTAPSRAPLFMHPGGERVMGWGVLPGVPPAYLEEALAKMEVLSELAIACGAKRYLSGWVSFDSPERWAAHYGERWPAVLAAKRDFDPDGVFGAEFVRFGR